MLPVTNHEQTLRVKEDELRSVKEQLQRFESESKEYEKKYQQVSLLDLLLPSQLLCFTAD